MYNVPNINLKDSFSEWLIITRGGSRKTNLHDLIVLVPYMHFVGLPTLVIIEVTVSLKTLVAVTTIVLLPTSRLVGGSLPVVWCEEYVAKWGVYRIQDTLHYGSVNNLHEPMYLFTEHTT